MICFYLKIAAESQRVSNRISGRVLQEFEPKKTIQEFDETMENRPTFIVENPTQKLKNSFVISLCSPIQVNQ